MLKSRLPHAVFHLHFRDHLQFSALISSVSETASDQWLHTLERSRLSNGREARRDQRASSPSAIRSIRSPCWAMLLS